MTIPKEELELLNQGYAFFGIKKGKYWDHERAMRNIIMLLHDAGFRVNWDHGQCYCPMERAKELPLYLRDDGRHVKTDITFELVPGIYVSVQIDTFKLKRMKDYKRIKNERRRRRRKKE